MAVIVKKNELEMYYSLVKKPRSTSVARRCITHR